MLIGYCSGCNLAPMRPGSYDVSVATCFSSIAASGFVMGGIKPLESRGPSLRYAAFMQGLRDAINARIRLTPR